MKNTDDVKHGVLYKKQCKYVGSIAVPHRKIEDRQRFINEKFDEIKSVVKGIAVVLMVTEEGVKILKENEIDVKMAHGVTRIMLSTCQPERRLFAYVAKTITTDRTSIIQAHMFKTKKASHTKELNVSLSKAFKLAFEKATLARKAREKLFDVESAANQRSHIKGKRWAKQEIARGHEHSLHAQQAKGKGSHAQDEKVKVENGGTSVDNKQLSSNNQKDTSSHKESTNEREAMVSCDSSIYEQPIDGSRSRHQVTGIEVSANTSKQQQNSEIVDIQGTPQTRDGKSSSIDSSFEVYLIDKKNEPLPPLPPPVRSARESKLFEMTEDEILRDAEWFQVGFSREIAESVLAERPIGSFYVRSSQTKVGSYVLTVKIPTIVKENGFANFLIETIEGKFRIKGFTSTFDSLSDIIAHYGSFRDNLPVQLFLGSDNKLCSASKRQNENENDNEEEEEDDDEDDYDDPDYRLYTSAEDMINELAKV